MIELRGAPYQQNARYVVATEPGDAGKEISLNVDVIVNVVADLGGALLLPADPQPGKPIRFVAVAGPISLLGNGHPIRPGGEMVPEGITLDLTFGAGVWTPAGAAAGPDETLAVASDVLAMNKSWTDQAVFQTVLSVPITVGASARLRYQAYASFFCDSDIAARTPTFRIRDSVTGVVAGSAQTVTSTPAGGKANVSMIAELGVVSGPRNVLLEVALAVGTVRIDAFTQADSEGAAIVVEELREPL